MALAGFVGAPVAASPTTRRGLPPSSLRSICGAPTARVAGASAPARLRMVAEPPPAVTAPVVTVAAAAELQEESSPPFRGRTGVVLMNIGTPASLSTDDVREYLRQFLGDQRVVDLPPVLKWFVLNLFILRTRPAESAEAYSSVWDPERGSPLLYHSEDLAVKLQSRLGDGFDVKLGMQYCEPNIATVMADYKASGVDRVVVVPMYPQFASSSTGAAVELVYNVAAKDYSTPYLHVVPAFYDHPAYIKSYGRLVRDVIGQGCSKFDHLLMSFHGVPEKHCTMTDDTEMYCHKVENCCSRLVQANRSCYRAQSFATARRLAADLDIPEGKYSIAFQSRLSAAGPEWIKPYTDLEFARLAREGVRKLAVVVPSFTVDCLETLEEIGIRGVEEFTEAGGEELTLIPCLNSDDHWADGLIEIMKDSCPMGTFK